MLGAWYEQEMVDDASKATIKEILLGEPGTATDERLQMVWELFCETGQEAELRESVLAIAHARLRRTGDGSSGDSSVGSRSGTNVGGAPNSKIGEELTAAAQAAAAAWKQTSTWLSAATPAWARVAMARVTVPPATPKSQQKEETRTAQLNSDFYQVRAILVARSNENVGHHAHSSPPRRPPRRS